MRAIVEREAELLGEMRGMPGAVQLHETIRDPRHLFLVMELCEGGELYELVARTGGFSEERAVGLFKVVVGCVAALHALSPPILHRDLKPENVLCHVHYGERAPEHAAADEALWCPVDRGTWVRPVVIDVGMSDRHRPDRDPPIRGVCGSPGFIAPETIEGKPHAPPMDVYALGVMLFMLLTGKVPFGEELSMNLGYSKLEVTQSKHWTDRFSADLSANARDLIVGLMRNDPEKRISLEEALAHPWLRPGGASTTPLSLMSRQEIQRTTIQRAFEMVNDCRDDVAGDGETSGVVGGDMAAEPAGASDGVAAEPSGRQGSAGGRPAGYSPPGGSSPAGGSPRGARTSSRGVDDASGVDRRREEKEVRAARTTAALKKQRTSLDEKGRLMGDSPRGEGGGGVPNRSTPERGARVEDEGFGGGVGTSAVDAAVSTPP